MVTDETLFAFKNPIRLSANILESYRSTNTAVDVASWMSMNDGVAVFHNATDLIVKRMLETGPAS